MAAAFGENQTRLALEGIRESGALRLKVVVRDVGLRCHSIHAQDVLNAVFGLTMRVQEEEPTKQSRDPRGGILVAPYFARNRW